MAEAMVEGLKLESALNSDLSNSEWLSMFERLDSLLSRANTVAQAMFNPSQSERLHDPFTTDEDVRQLLDQQPGVPLVAGTRTAADHSSKKVRTASSRLEWLKLSVGLSVFDMDALPIGQAPEFDLKYERLNTAAVSILRGPVGRGTEMRWTMLHSREGRSPRCRNTSRQ